jgi:hypothetical protein
MITSNVYKIEEGLYRCQICWQRYQARISADETDLNVYLGTAQQFSIQLLNALSQPSHQQHAGQVSVTWAITT